MPRRSGIFWFNGQLAWFNAFDPEGDAEAVFEDWAPQVEAYAQANAPWADNTGDARAGLVAEVSSQGGEVTLSLSHSVDYGQWLETIQDGEYAIIMPTLEHFAPQIFAEAGVKAGSVEGEDGDP